MARSVTGALMGDPGFGASPAARAYEPGVFSVPCRPKLATDRCPSTAGAPDKGYDHPPGEQDGPAGSAPATTVAPAAREDSPELRPVAPLKADLQPGDPATPPPVFMDVAPTELLIDGAYRRDLSNRSLRLIQRIVEGWDWRRFKPPVCAMTAEGFVVIDGQHTAIAAATHGGIPTIPIMVVEAKEQREQASAFVGHNRDRLALHPTQIHRGAVAAGNPDAMRLERVVTAAGARIVRAPYGSKKYVVGDTIAVGTIANLIRDRGERFATDLLRLLVEGGCGLIGKDQIRAATALLTDDAYREEFDWSDLPVVIRRTADTVEKEAKRFAADHNDPYWRGLVHVWFRAVKKRRKA